MQRYANEYLGLIGRGLSLAQWPRRNKSCSLSGCRRNHHFIGNEFICKVLHHVYALLTLGYKAWQFSLMVEIGDLYGRYAPH